MNPRYRDRPALGGVHTGCLKRPRRFRMRASDGGNFRKLSAATGKWHEPARAARIAIAACQRTVQLNKAARLAARSVVMMSRVVVVMVMVVQVVITGRIVSGAVIAVIVRIVVVRMERCSSDRPCGVDCCARYAERPRQGK